MKLKTSFLFQNLIQASTTTHSAASVEFSIDGTVYTGTVNTVSVAGDQTSHSIILPEQSPVPSITVTIGGTITASAIINSADGSETLVFKDDNGNVLDTVVGGGTDNTDGTYTFTTSVISSLGSAGNALIAAYNTAGATMAAPEHVSVSENSAEQVDVTVVNSPYITGNYSAGKLNITLSAEATTSDLEAALETVAYNNTSNDPSNASR